MCEFSNNNNNKTHYKMNLKIKMKVIFVKKNAECDKTIVNKHVQSLTVKVTSPFIISKYSPSLLRNLSYCFF